MVTSDYRPPWAGSEHPLSLFVSFAGLRTLLGGCTGFFFARELALCDVGYCGPMELRISDAAKNVVRKKGGRAAIDFVAPIG